MNRFVISFALVLAALPVQAQDVEPDPDPSDGAQMLEKGMRLLLEGMLEELEPALRELGPMIKDLEGRIIDLNGYHKPEILPNGDIIIRRKEKLDPPVDGDVDL